LVPLVQIIQFDLQGAKKISPFNPEFLFKKALSPPATGKGLQACTVAHCGQHEKFTFLPFTAEKQTFHATLGS
jgi:hypothetical protein